MTDTEGNSMFCGPKTVNVSRHEAGIFYYHISSVKTRSF